MLWTLTISKQAEKDLQWFREHNKSLYLKCFDLTREVIKEPFQGIGKPEHLKRLGGNVWSRRISHEHRMVYEVFYSLIKPVQYFNSIYISNYRDQYTKVTQNTRPKRVFRPLKTKK